MVYILTAESYDLNKIINNGYCIGCGGCSAASGSVSMEMSSDGQLVPKLNQDYKEIDRTALSVCPFSNEGPNEDEISKPLYQADCDHDSRMGWYNGLYAGHAVEGSFREKGASGGIITWVLAEMLKRDLVDAVIHVRRTDPAETGRLFQYSISRTEAEISEGGKSRYYPIEMSQVMDEVRRTPGRYVFVGIPCFVKAARKLAKQDPIIDERIVHTVGLVCGHLKSKSFSDALAWEKGIAPGQLEEIDFRVKLPGRGASDYGVYMRSPSAEHTAPIRELLGGDWGLNFFRHNACDYCDDVFAETADVAVGDAWLPEYSSESEGNSVVVVRSSVIGNLIEEGRANGRVQLDAISADRMAQSQAGGLRDRREGLAYRLSVKKSSGEWAPKKRIEASSSIPDTRKKIYDQRSKLREASHAVWQEVFSDGTFQDFKTRMMPEVSRMRSLYKSPLLVRIAGKLKREAQNLLKSKSKPRV